MAAAAVAFLVLAVHGRQPTGPSAIVEEALADHLSIVTSAHPLDVEGGGVHR